MPCMDGGPSYDDYDRMRDEISELSIILCAICEDLENENKPIPNRAIIWWEEHKEADRKREAKEEAEKEEQNAREKALDKLTASERRLLDL